MVRRLLLYLTTVLFLGFLSCVIYIKLTINLNLPAIDSKGSVPVELNLEKGSLVNENLVQNFLLLLDHRSEDLTESLRGSEVIRDLSLKGEATSNSCTESQCLQRLVKMSEMSPYIWEALISVEDSRFLSHLGLDPTSILRAVVVNVFKGRYAQGASTITQQLVKNIFLSSEKTLWRKFKEALISIYIEIVYDKDEIIETYLNNVYWGSFQGIKIKGVEAASNFYFKKSSKGLSFNESLILVSMLKGPNLYNPLRNIKLLNGRVLQLSNKLRQNNILNSAELDTLKHEMDKWFGGFGSSFDTSFFKFLMNLKEERLLTYDDYVLFSSGLKIKKKFQKLFNVNFDFEVLRRRGERIKYTHSFYEQKLRHQLGSILKPLIYSLILEGDNLDEEISTLPLKIKLKSGEWSPRDHVKKNETKVTIKKAIQKSLNVPLIRMAQQFGFDRLEKELLVYIPRLKTPLREYPSQLLGAVELNLFELDLLFQKFFSSVCREQAFRLVYDALTDPSITTVSNRSKKLAGLSFFGKTGTSNKAMDNWFVFHGGDETIITWFGFLGRRQEQSFKLSGASTSFEILKGYLLARGKRVGQFSCD